jgi:tRNA(Ile2)-agmatinylcytidine synthase
VYEIIKGVLKKQAYLSDENTNPGFVVLTEKPKSDIYEKTVKQIVTLDEIIATLHRLEAVFEGYKNQRGLIGATAAISWDPADRTFELIAYRLEKRWGTKRSVDENSVKKMDAAFPLLFDNYDFRNHHNRITPNSPCPILFGIRGDDVVELKQAMKTVNSEPIESWLIFETNQGTDDHLQSKQIIDIHPFESVIVEGQVTKEPYTIQGGHVLFTIADGSGSISCAAYEPTKEFRTVVRQLRVGDILRVYGGVRAQPLSINLEKIFITQLSTMKMKKENPLCPECRKHMKSKGTGQGYKCIRCKTTSNEPVLWDPPRSIISGFFEVPVCARRHMSKPLKRLIRYHPSNDPSIGTVYTP